MNAAHIHLLLNHIPVVGLGVAVLVLIYSMAKKNDELTKLTLVGLVALALVTIPVFLTGEPAEEIVEHLPGVSEGIIDKHQDAATASFIAIEFVGAVSLACLVLFRRSKPVPKGLAAFTLVASLAAAGLVSWTANLGGQIRHTEIRAGAPATGAADEKTQDNEEEREKKDRRRDDR